MAITAQTDYEEAIDLMWAEMRRMEVWTVRQVADFTGFSPERVRAYTNALILAGHVAEIGAIAGAKQGARKPRALTVIKDTGAEAPRIDLKGRPLPPSPSEQLWRTARILKRFTLRELIINASTEECCPNYKTAANYFHRLARAGLVARGRGESGQVVYRMIASRSGPLHPIVSRAGGRIRVIDRNNDTVWEEGRHG